MKKEKKETGYKLIKTVLSKKKPRRYKYQHIYDLLPRDPETGEGMTVVYDNTPKNYTLLCSGCIPKLNKQYAPMKWVFTISDDRKHILIQRAQ